MFICENNSVSCCFYSTKSRHATSMMSEWESSNIFFFNSQTVINSTKENSVRDPPLWVDPVFIYLREIYSSKMREWAITWQVFLLRHLWTPLEGIWLNLSKEERLRFLLWKFLHKSRTLSTLQKKDNMGFPGGAVVKNPPANAGDTGSSPGLGRSHMPRSN